MKKQVLLSLVLVLLSAFLSGCGCGGGDETPYLVSIEVSPANPSIVVGMSQQFKATGVFSNSTTLDLTEAVVWTTSDHTIAAISNAEHSMGLAQGAAAGATTVTATSGAVSGSTLLTVRAPELVSLAVTPANASIPLGSTQQFTATGTYSDGSHQNLTAAATWSSSATAIATVNNTAGSKGLADSHAVGTTTVTATYGTVSGSTTLTVTGVSLVAIQVTPANPVVALGTPKQFTATGTYSDGSQQDITTAVTWSSSDTTIATISNAAGTKGQATTDHKRGTTTITATQGTISGSTQLIDP